eukprot:SAG31_NODE_5107_length_2740_cov_4.443014_1_plen_308_part_00
MRVAIGVQAYTARQAERSLAEQAHEQHVHELMQQRDHERLVAQIARTGRAVDDCGSPVIRGLGSYFDARKRFVAACAMKVEASQPEVFTELYTRGSYAMKHGLELVAGSDGAVRFAGQLLVDPTNEPKGKTWAAPTIYSSRVMGCSPRALDVTWSDLMTNFSQPHCRELPEAFFELMAADLDGPLAEGYRGYIRCQVKPVLEMIANTVAAHYAVVEPPPIDWLIEKFPGHTKADSPNAIVDSAIAYPRAWARVLVEWDAGRIDLLYPPSHMVPAGAMYAFFEYSRQRGEAKRECGHLSICACRCAFR